MTNEVSFPHRRAGHCGSGALRDLLEHHGLDYGDGPLSEGMVFGLAGGLGFFYAESTAFTPPFYLVGRTADLERDIATNLEAELEVRETDDAELGWSWVADELAAGRPVMVWADIAKLEYLRVKMSNTRHDILIVGHDPESDMAWVADNDREELQACSLKSLAAARTSSGFPGPNRNTTFLYTWPEALPHLRTATRRAVAQAVTNMTAEAPEVAGLTGGFGLAGVDAFLAGYERWPETLADLLPSALPGLWVFVVKAGTGGAMFRSLHSTFLHEASTLLKDSQLAAVANHYDQLAARWIELAECAKHGTHADGLPLVRMIRDLEHRGVEMMEALT